MRPQERRPCRPFLPMPTFKESRFELAHDAFRQWVEGKSPGGRPFDGFTHPVIRDEEIDYKYRVRGRASELLQLKAWPQWIDGDRRAIFRATLAACDPNVSSNLMEVRRGDRGNSASPLFMTARRSEAAQVELGGELYHLFLGGEAHPAAFAPRFERFVAYVAQRGLGRSWPFFGYLAWLMAPDRYFPVLPTVFQRALHYFGGTARLVKNIQWAPYKEVLSLFDWVQELLAVRYRNVGVIEAHSFLWIVGRNLLDDLEGAGGLARCPRSISAPDFDLELVKRRRAAERREEIGLAGERLVYERERERLMGAGRTELAEAVTLVSSTNREAGYDVLSFDDDGTERHIEVKATTEPSQSGRGFFLSENERAVAESDQLWRLVRVWSVFQAPQPEDIGNIVRSRASDWELEHATWYARPYLK